MTSPFDCALDAPLDCFDCEGMDEKVAVAVCVDRRKVREVGPPLPSTVLCNQMILATDANAVARLPVGDFLNGDVLPVRNPSTVWYERLDHRLSPTFE